MIKKVLGIFLLVTMAGCNGCKDESQTTDETSSKKNEDTLSVISSTLPLADPYVMLYDGIYYIYGTNVGTGFDVYTSNDLQYWKRESSLSLNNKDSYGEDRFWAPEVYYVEKENKFYMFYSTEEHICVATSDSPSGPFKQDVKEPIREEKSIDTSVFFDEDGKAYLYFVRFTDGNAIWCAELQDDLRKIKEETLTQCLVATEDWELIWPKVVEGPSVFKQDGTYYMMYSANSYESQDYAVGYATADSPLGPWRRYEGNPVLHKYDNLTGVGHGAPFTDKEGKRHYVFHAHKSQTEIHPRTSHFVDMSIDNGIVKLDGNLINPVVVDKLPQ